MAGYRNPFEARVAKALGPAFEYEAVKLTYTLTHSYLPDFIDHQAKRIVEAKGLFDAADRRKMLAVQKAYPGYQIDLCFSNADRPISKGSKTTYRAWCAKHGFGVVAAPPRR